MSLKRSFFLIVFLAFGFFVYWLANLIWFKPLSIDNFYDRGFARILLRDPETLTQLGILESKGIRFHNAYLSDASPETERWKHAYEKEQLDILKSYDRESQTQAQLLSTDVLAWFLGQDVASEPFMFYPYAVTQIDGVHIDLPRFMLEIHPLTSKSDAEAYVSRLSRFKQKFDEVIAGMQESEARAVMPPRFVVEGALKIARDFIVMPPKENVLYTGFSEKLAKLPELIPEQRERLLADAETQIANSVYPAYRDLIAHEESLLPKTTTDDGVWKLPNGDAYYRNQLRAQTTTDITPAEVHDLGLAEVARIGAEMKVEFAKLGYPEDIPLAEAVHRLAADPAQRYTPGPNVRKQITGDFQKIIDEVSPRLTKVFRVLPKAPLKVESIPEFSEKSAPLTYYEPGSADGARPGIFFANTGDLDKIARYGMKTVTYHEGVPGHHFQISIQQELDGVPEFRRFLPFTAYQEGWALYAERLASEIGMYENDPAGNIGRLQDEMLRAVRLVVDSGIHYKHWTRQQAIDYMAENTGNSMADVVVEIERYIVWPGQACAYKVGQLKILALREKARAALGAKFDLGEFHDVVLKNGSLPLTILEQVVDTYIAQKKA
jgi:uncharacterized protein (DUF885 family)